MLLTFPQGIHPMGPLRLNALTLATLVLLFTDGFALNPKRK